MQEEAGERFVRSADFRSVCVPQSCPRSSGGKNAKLIISPFKDSFILRWVEYEKNFLKVPIYEEKSTFNFLVFIYFGFVVMRNLWRVCAYGEDRCQKGVENYKCLICCCT